MPNRQDLPSMSTVSSQKRLATATSVLGTKVTGRIIALALYFLGANLKALAEFVGLPVDTIKSLARRTLSDGLPALEDRRHGTSAFLPKDETPRHLSCKLLFEEEVFVVEFDGVKRIELLRRNPVQCRTVLLTLLNADLLDIEDVSQALGLSRERTRRLCRELAEDGVSAVLDKRRGQQADYLFTSEVKSELVQQFMLNALSGRPTSGRAIAEDLQQRCEMELSERSVRLHLNKLGLPRIADSLPELLDTQKKTSSES